MRTAWYHPHTLPFFLATACPTLLPLRAPQRLLYPHMAGPATHCTTSKHTCHAWFCIPACLVPVGRRGEGRERGWAGRLQERSRSARAVFGLWPSTLIPFNASSPPTPADASRDSHAVALPGRNTRVILTAGGDQLHSRGLCYTFDVIPRYQQCYSRTRFHTPGVATRHFDVLPTRDNI